MRRAARYTEADLHKPILPKSFPEYPYLHRETTRHGKVVFYVRRGAGPRVRIYENPSDQFFSDTYKRALEAAFDPAKRVIRGRKSGGVYFILDGRLVKIGYSVAPLVRRATLQTSSPRPLRIYYVADGDPSLERQLHRLFAADHVAGEWFKFSKAIKTWIAQDEAHRIRQLKDAK